MQLWILPFIYGLILLCSLVLESSGFLNSKYSIDYSLNRIRPVDETENLAIDLDASKNGVVLLHPKSFFFEARSRLSKIFDCLDGANPESLVHQATFDDAIKGPLFTLLTDFEENVAPRGTDTTDFFRDVLRQVHYRSVILDIKNADEVADFVRLCHTALRALIKASDKAIFVKPTRGSLRDRYHRSTLEVSTSSVDKIRFEKQASVLRARLEDLKSLFVQFKEATDDEFKGIALKCIKKEARRIKSLLLSGNGFLSQIDATPVEKAVMKIINVADGYILLEGSLLEELDSIIDSFIDHIDFLVQIF
jgi:hypothetical protein